MSLAKKLEIIRLLKVANKLRSAIAKEFGVAKSAVTSIVKNKQKIVDASDTVVYVLIISFTPERKRL